MRTKHNIYKKAEYAALVNNRLVPDEGSCFSTIKDAEQVARQYARPGDVIEVFDVTHQVTIVITRIRKGG